MSVEVYTEKQVRRAIRRVLRDAELNVLYEARQNGQEWRWVFCALRATQKQAESLTMVSLGGRR